MAAPKVVSFHSHTRSRLEWRDDPCWIGFSRTGAADHRVAAPVEASEGKLLVLISGTALLSLNTGESYLNIRG
jgi:hypothetical protein